MSEDMLTGDAQSEGAWPNATRIGIVRSWKCTTTCYDEGVGFKTLNCCIFLALGLRDLGRACVRESIAFEVFFFSPPSFEYLLYCIQNIFDSPSLENSFLDTGFASEEFPLKVQSFIIHSESGKKYGTKF